MDVKEYLKHHTLLFDGGMGFYYHEQYPDGGSCEQANFIYPERIESIHRAYIEAGANAIKTNTFAANTGNLKVTFSEVKKTIEAAWNIANRAVSGTETYVFADIGPLPGFAPDESEYEQIVDTFLKLGAKNFLFETFADLSLLPQLAGKIKKACKDSFIMVSFGAMAEGFTTAGQPVWKLIRQAGEIPQIDCVGLNCVSGPGHMVKMVLELSKLPGYFSVMPNAGYPTINRGVVVYGGKAQYFAQQMAKLQALGVKILGGCCGTTPEFIRQSAKLLKYPQVLKEDVKTTEKKEKKREQSVNRLAEKLDAGVRVIALELDPPADDDIAFFMESAKRLKEAGVDAVTVADCPIARARADSSMLSAKLHRELDIDPIPHMTCRDRNINATRALLLGLSIEEVYNVLLVTGDPIPSTQREQIKAVFSFNSAVLASYIKTLEENRTIGEFRIFGALNVNAKNFDAELKKALRKEESGVQAFLTQPVFTPQAFENLKQASERLHATILGGIYPIISHKNATFMNSEVAGVEVSQEIMDRYENLSREEAEELAVEISVTNAKKMMPYTGGWYLMTPFKRIGLMERIVKELCEMKK